MRRTRVKICGITRVEDALACARFGADAIGLVFYPDSPRNISAQNAAAILARLPAFVTTVGLFVDAPAEQVASVLSQVPLDCLQFHGDEEVSYCEQFSRPYIKAIRVGAQTEVKSAISHYASAQAILLDTYVAGQPGGTGQSFDWQRVPQDGSKEIILAGGLDAQNVAAAINTAHPYAVDVSGGVERSKGIKDHNKIEQFINEVQSIGAP